MNGYGTNTMEKQEVEKKTCFVCDCVHKGRNEGVYEHESFKLPLSDSKFMLDDCCLSVNYISGVCVCVC